jgi:hypothetical protein
MRAKLYHHDFSSDPSIRVKVGPGVNESCYNGKYVRWGDYTGICRHYGSTTPTVWIAGSVGSDLLNIWWTYLAELKAVATSGEDQSVKSELVLFPNPAGERMKIQFELREAGPLQFSVFNSSGQLISTIFESAVAQGMQEFSFSTGSLAPGSYFLKIIRNNHEIIHTAGFVVGR